MLRQTTCLLILTRSQLWQAWGRHGFTLAEKNNVHLSEEGCLAISLGVITLVSLSSVDNLNQVTNRSLNFSSSETSCADAMLTSTGLNSVEMQSSRHQERCGHVLSALAASHGLCIFLQETKTMTRYSQTGIQDNHLVAKCNRAILGNRDYKYAWVGKINK